MKKVNNYYKNLRNVLIVLLREFEIDNAATWGILYRVAETVMGPITMMFIISFFTSELQGYYYTFKNILNFQSFADMGLGYVIIQFASHEYTKLKLGEDGNITGDYVALSRFISLGRFSLRWFFIASLAFMIFMIPFGILFFSVQQSSDIEWLLPWIIVSIFTGISLLSIPLLSLLEGCCQISWVYKVRFLKTIIINILCWVAIYSGFKLWSTSVYAMAGVLVTLIVLGYKYKNFIKLMFLSLTGPKIEWKKEVLPMQWRMACSYVIGGYLSFYLFTPVLFYYHGPVIAGQMGMTWALISALSAVSIMIIYTKSPKFSIMIANKEYQKLDKTFYSSTIGSVALCILGAVGIWFFVYMINYLHIKLSSRLLSPSIIALLLIATVLWQITFAQSIYLRAHKKEPFLLLSVISGILIALFTIILGKRYSATGIAVGYLCVTIFFVFPYGTLTWIRCRKLWH